MATMQEVFGVQLELLFRELARRATQVKINRCYYEGTFLRDTDFGVPAAVKEARLKNTYWTLMSLAMAPWGSLVVDSVQDRLEATGIDSGDREIDKAIWQIWQENALDAESKVCHAGALTDGRAFATIWPGDDNRPEIVYDSAEQMVVAYREGRHQPRHRVAALRYWTDESTKRKYATLYRADGIFRFQDAKNATEETVRAFDTLWERRQPDGEDWPAPNPFNVVPVVELATNRRLKSGPFPYARGEFQHCTGLIDQINLLTFLGLVVAIWMGFPLRGVTGMEVQRRILVDDDGNALIDEDTGKPKSEVKPPYEARPDTVVQATDPNAKFFQLDAADRKNLAVFTELQHLAMLTKTPRHYFPNDGGLSNISADTIRADEGALGAKVKGIHKPFLGEGHEEVLRVAGLMLPDGAVELPQTAELEWADHESRSMAERADAATKVASIGLPWQIVAERYLNFTQGEILRAEAAGAGTQVLSTLMAGLQSGNGGAGRVLLPAGTNGGQSPN